MHNLEFDLSRSLKGENQCAIRKPTYDFLSVNNYNYVLILIGSWVISIWKFSLHKAPLYQSAEIWTNDSSPFKVGDLLGTGICLNLFCRQKCAIFISSRQMSGDMMVLVLEDSIVYQKYLVQTFQIWQWHMPCGKVHSRENWGELPPYKIGANNPFKNDLWSKTYSNLFWIMLEAVNLTHMQ